MRKTILIVVLVLFVGAFAVYNLTAAQAKTGKGDLVLTAKKVKSAPKDASSSEWSKAKASRFALVGAGSVEGKNLELKAKSVYTKDQIFFRLEWADKDKSMDKNAWKFTGKREYSQSHIGSRIEHKSNFGCFIWWTSKGIGKITKGFLRIIRYN